MLTPQNLVLFFSDSMRLIVAQHDPQASGTQWGALLMPVAGFALLVVVLLGFQFLNHRRRLEEMKLKTLESLARQGKIGREDIDKAIRSDQGWAKKVLVFSWIGFVISIFFVVVSQLSYRWRDGLLPAAFAAVVFLALLSVPFLLSEYRRIQEP